MTVKQPQFGLGYLAVLGSQKLEIRDATSLYDAKQKAIARLKIPKSKQGLLSVCLAESDGRPVVQTLTD